MDDDTQENNAPSKQDADSDDLMDKIIEALKGSKTNLVDVDALAKAAHSKQGGNSEEHEITPDEEITSEPIATSSKSVAKDEYPDDDDPQLQVDPPIKTFPAMHTAEILGLNPPPYVKYDPLSTHDGMTSFTIPSKITVNPRAFSEGPLALFDLVAYETTRAAQHNLRWRVNSSQSESNCQKKRHFLTTLAGAVKGIGVQPVHSRPTRSLPMERK